MFANSMPIQQDSPTICLEPVACSATISVLRIRISPSKRLYVFNPDTTLWSYASWWWWKSPGGSYRCELAWIFFRCRDDDRWQNQAQPTSLRKLASYPRQNNLAVALREVGRIERTIIGVILIRTCSGVLRSGLNKGERPTMRSKNALRIGRQWGNSRSHDRGAALPNRWAQFIDCGDHLLGIPSILVMPSRSGGNEGLMFPLNFFPTYPHWAGRTFY